jgi:hypothetical protein
MYVTRISRYIFNSVLSAVSRNQGRSWNVLPIDTGALLYLLDFTSSSKTRYITLWHEEVSPTQQLQQLYQDTSNKH